MRETKQDIFIAILVLLLITSTACISNDKSCGGLQDMEYANQTTYDEPVSNEHGVEQFIPVGFISLNESMNLLDNGLRYVFWESQISFLDADNICIYQTSESNKSFIVRCGDAYYVDAQKISELAAIADATYLARIQVYAVGEPIHIRFRPPTLRMAALTVVEVSYVYSCDVFDLGDDEWLCIVKVSLEVDYGNQYDKEYFETHNVAWKYFDFAETANGYRFSEILQNDSNEVIAIRLPRGEEIANLYITSPLFAYKSISRVVDLSS